ncbi:ABC transporter ATP-binding protein [Dysosmobacter sp. Sow4_B12]|uniref:ABC transporter ATP-binding protein n=1 Tax=Dysosmobacter sp. Sow4_B12 TaxID=3438777 RepID=UPI003F920AC5
MDNKTEQREVAIRLSGVKKMYKLGQIGGGTLQGDLQSWWARVRGREDPNTKIGTDQRLVGQTFMALNGIDLTVYKGEALGIIGGNGAGKSTMLKLLSRVTAPTEGEIDIYGRIASMLEVGTGFNGEMTGRENIYMNGTILGMTKAEIDAKMEDIIDFSEVREFIDTPVKRYSSGMYVKLAFSVAAHLDSEIMIMDEVLAVGDMAFQKKCLDKMRDAAKKEGRTVLYVSHNMNTIRQLCDRCIVLDKGKVVFEGDVEEAISRYMQETKSKNTRIDFSEVVRADWLKDPYIKLLSAEYVGKDTIAFEQTERIHLKLEWENLKDVVNAGLRVEIWSMDRTAIATYVLYECYSGKAGEHGSFLLELDISQLAEASYQMIYTFFSRSELGGNQDLDCVDGLCFDIANVKKSEKLLWRPKYWGYIRMPSPKVIEKKIDSEGNKTWQ